jgi:FkbM family methyltransferase
MPVISFAQNGEDILLRRVFDGQADGFYVDIGANDPIENSVTRLFSIAGWRGVNVEPVPSAFERLRADRPRDVNLNLGLSDRTGRMTLYGMPGIEAYSSIPETFINSPYFPTDPDAIIAHDIPVITLRDLCEQHVDRPIDFLKIDVDGHELEVIAGGDWSRWRPRVVLVEDHGTHLWEPLLLGADYHLATFDGVNRYYVRAEDLALIPRFSPLPNFTDDFIPYRFQREIDHYRDLLGEVATMGPTALDVARRLKKISHRHPTLARVVRGALRIDR